MTTPVLRGSTAPLPGRPDGTPFGQNTLQATSPDTTLVGDLILCVSWHTYGEIGGGSALTLRSGEGWTQLINFVHNDGSTDGTLGIAWKIATLAGAQVYQAFNSSSPTTDCRTALRVYEVGTFDTTGFIAATPVSFTDGNLAPDSPIVSGLDSARDYLIEAIGGWWCNNGTVNALPGAPSGYTSLIETASAGWSELAIAKKAVAGVTSENPGIFTDNLDSTTSSGSVGATIAILGAPGIARRAIIGSGELEVPETPPQRRAVVGQIELEVPNKKLPDTLTFLFHRHWARYRFQSEDPQPESIRRAVITQAELEVPNLGRRAILGWSEFEIPFVNGLGLGIFQHRPPSTQQTSYVASIGRYPDVWLDYNGANFGPDNWTAWSNPPTQYDYKNNWGSFLVANPDRRFVLMQGMCPWGPSHTNGERLPEVISGLRDPEWHLWADYFAQANVASDSSPLYICLGWEMDGNWFPWACDSNATHMANWKAAWQHIVTVVRNRQPIWSQKVKWCFCPSVVRGYFSKGISWAEAIYPGDSYVDLIGGNFYDQWPDYSVPPTEAQKVSVWNNRHAPALVNLNTFAQTHGKRQFWAEWALVHSDNPSSSQVWGGDDNPLFVQNSYNWATTHDYEFVAWFNVNGPPLDHSLTTFRVIPFTNSRNTFLNTFAQLPHPWA